MTTIANTYSAGSASVDIAPDFDGFVTQLRAYLERVDAELPVTVTADTDRARGELEELSGQDWSTEVTPDVDTTAAREELDALTQARVAQIEARTEGVEERRAQLDALAGARVAQIEARVEKEVRARERLDEIAGARVAEIEARTEEGERVQERLDEIAGARVAQIEARVEQGAQAQERLDQIAQARVAEIEARTEGVEERRAQLEELARERIAKIRADVDARNLAQARRELDGLGDGAGSATRSLSALSVLKFGGLAAGLTALIPVIGGVAAAAGGLVALLGGIAGAGAIGGSGIVGAFKAMKEGSEGAGEAATKHAEDLNQVTDAQQRVVDAQHNEQESLRSVQDAQESLTRARKDAKDAIDDLNLAVENGVLSERGAELAYRRAVVNLQKIQAQANQGKASGLDVEEAQLGVDRAAQNITDVRVRNQQTQRKAGEANIAGVEGSDQVQSAQRSLEQAQYGVQQAQLETAKAVRELAKAQQDAATSAADAAGGTNKFAEAMAKLSPAAAAFVLAMQALGPQWTELRKAVQENLFAGLGESVTTLAQHQLPALKDGLSQIATGMNAAIKDTLSSLDSLFTRLEASGTMQAFIDGVNQALQSMAPVVTALADVFIQLGAAIGPHVTPFLTALSAAFTQIAGPLGALGGVFLDALTSLLPTLSQLITALANGLAPVLPVVGGLLDAVGQALIPLIPSVSQIVQIIGNALTEAVRAIGPYLPTIAQAFADILQAVAPLVGPLAQIVGLFAGALAQSVSALAVALAPVVVAFADGLRPVIPILAEHFAKLAPIFAQVAQLLGQALAQALEKIMPVLPQLIQAWSDMVVALAPLLPPLVDLAVQILPILADILVRTAPLIVELLKSFTDLANFVVPILIPMFGFLKDAITTNFEWMTHTFDVMITALGKLRDGFRDLIGEIIQIWKDLIDKLDSPFRVLGGAAGKVLGAVIDKIGGHAEGGMIEGPGTGTSDSIIARLSDGEYVVNAASTRRYRGLIEAINADTLPRFAAGGDVQFKQTATGQPPIVTSMAQVVAARFPGMTLTSGIRNTNDWHGQGKAADFSNGSDDTPEMQSLASFVASNYPNSLELIHSPFTHNIKNGRDVGDGLGVYGGPTMAQHRNHVHWAVDAAVTAPQAGTSPTAAAQSNPDNYSPTGTYVGPSTVDTTIDRQQAQKDQLPKQYSLPGILGRAGEILGEGILAFFGLENSALSGNNPYNRAVSETVNFYANKNQQGQTAPTPLAPSTVPGDTTETPTGTTGPDAQAAQQPAAPAAPAKHVYDPNGGAEQWRGTVLAVLQGTGRNTGLADRTLAQIRIESGGNPNAQNDYDINAQHGTPSIGLLQVIKPTFDAYADPRFPGGQRDPEPNIAAAYNYVDKRYGGAERIWPTTTGYADGGWIGGPGNGTSDSVPIWASAGEFVVNAAAAASNRDWLQAINAGTARAPVAPAGLGRAGGSTTTNRDHSVNIGRVVTLNHEEFMRQQDRWVEQQSMGALAAHS